MFLRSLSGRFLLLTIIFVMIAEVLIFVPSIARFRLDYLSERLERAQIASLSVLASSNSSIDNDLEVELLSNAEVLSIALRRDEIRELVLALPMPAMVEETFDLRDASPWVLMRDALRTLFIQDHRVVRVIGEPVKGGGLQIEATLYETPLKVAMLDYGRNILWLSLLISAITAALLFMAVRYFIVRPISRVVKSMVAFQDNPEDVRSIIVPDAGVSELRQAETALQDMQNRISGSLKQKERLAQLGGAVAKISHDLRNMLTTAQLFTDRIEMSSDPAVAKTAPKLVSSLSRAINLCEQTLTFGKAEEAAPNLSRFELSDVVADVVEAESLRATKGLSELIVDVPDGLALVADPEQIYRVIINLARNARQAIENSGVAGEVRVSASEDGESVIVKVADTGPGLPKKAREHLFKPFEGGTRREGTGLGLAIAAELIRGHGGQLNLEKTDEAGTTFTIVLPSAL